MSSDTNSAVAHRLQRCYILAIGIAIAAGIILHEVAERRQVDQLRSMAGASLAQNAAARIRDDRLAGRDGLQSACLGLLDDPAVLAVCVWDRGGTRLAASAIADALVDAIAPVSTEREVTITEFTPPSSLANHLPRMQRVNLSLGMPRDEQQPARMAMLIAPDRLIGSNRGVNWCFAGPLIAVGILLIAAAAIHNRRLVSQPLAELQALVEAGPSDRSRRPISARQDAWGRIGRCIEDLRAEMDTVRQHVERIERRADQQIADETKRIARNLKRLERQSCIDPLTRLMNRRVLDERLPEIFAAQKACGGDLSVIMMDLDKFKVLNDTAGHAAGDDVLEVAGQLLTQCARRQDLAVRYGGDEFQLILPGVCAADAERMAQRLIAMFAQQVKVMFPGCGVSMSAGVASLMLNLATTPHELIELADSALYQAKRAGRRCVRVCAAHAVAV